MEYEAAISDAVVVCPPVPAPADFPFYLQPSAPPRPRPLAAPPDTSYTPPCPPTINLHTSHFLLAHPRTLKTLTVEGSAPQTGRSYTLCVDNSKIRYSTTASDGSSIGIFNGTDYWHLTADTTKVRPLKDGH